MPRFTVVNNNEVLDHRTDIVWMHTPLPNCMTFAEAKKAPPAGWRLPTIDELVTLIDYTQSKPALPLGHPFSGVQSSNYWSSSACVNYPNFAWFVYFYNGYVYACGKTNSLYVWPVRIRARMRNEIRPEELEP